jgi:hypothetical protein
VAYAGWRSYAASILRLKLAAQGIDCSDINSDFVDERLGGAYAIATAVDHLIDRLQTNATLNNRNQKVNEFHAEQYKAGYKFMVTAWCIEVTGGPKCYPGRDMFESHKHLGLTDYEI